MTVPMAWRVVGTMKSNISRGVQVKEKGLAPDVTVRVADGREFAIRTIGRDFSVHLKGWPGAHNPMMMEPLS